MNLTEEIKKRKLAIFDFDGLMVNSEQVIYSALEKLFAKYNIDLSWSYFARHIGTPVHIALPAFYNDHQLPISYADFLIQRDRLIIEAIKNDLQLMPGLTSLLSLLTSKGYILSIGTSAKRVYLENVLRKYNILSYFSHIVTIDDVKRGKPFPDIFLTVLHQANINARDAFVLEDSPNGIQAAKKAKIMSVAVPAREVGITNFSDATFVVNSLESITHALNELG